MYKKEWLFICCIFIINVSFAQIVNDDAAFFNNRYDRNLILKKRVEQIQIKMYALNELYSIQTFYFDTSGLMYQQKIADSSGKINAQFDFSYNSFGDLIYREQQDFELKNHDTTIFYRTYNDSLLVREATSLTPVVNEYFYDTSKRRIKTISCFMQHNDCLNKRIITNTYDKSNKLIRVKELSYKNKTDSAGILTSERELTYNIKGKIVFDKELIKGEDVIHSSKGSITYLYDGNDNLTEIINTNGTTNKYKYGTDGLIFSKELIISMDGNQTSVNDIYSYKFRKKY